MDKEKIQADFQIDSQLIADQLMRFGPSQAKILSIIIRSTDFFAKAFSLESNVCFVFAIDHDQMGYNL